MMYKYLAEKLNRSHPVVFESITNITLEGFRDGESDIIKDFMNLDYSDMCEILGFIDISSVHESIKEYIENKEFIRFFLDSEKGGFLSKIHIPIHTDFSFNEKGEVIGSRCSQGYCRIGWVYADTLGELVEKAILKSEQSYNKCLEKEKNKNDSQTA